MRKTARCLLPLLCLLLSGCTDASYYLQSITGQCRILLARKEISQLLADSELEPALRRKLELVLRLRNFAADELHLPVEGCYRTYADLNRPYAVWNVVATPEFSLEPLRWCFPVVGCVPYRGYFSEQAALAFADRLAARGNDVLTCGVAAYSTLGWFDDPVLNTFVDRSDADLAGLIFHELSHRLLYVADDAGFSESFARFFEIEGVSRWLRKQGRSDELARYRRRLELTDAIHQLARQIRDRLDALYHSDLDAAAKRREKKRLFAAFAARAAAIAARHGAKLADWLQPERLNNARFVMLATYQDLVPAFRHLLTANGGDLEALYRQVRTIAGQPAAERRRVMTFWQRRQRSPELRAAAGH
ncbi:putative aminopeptidase [Geothermobacter ehrlichii]|uniref:Putative aminopeptidase n=1 Tax=Geothermobacter ehrlichii TaxID=213224 RepID=A0A5D3WP29_9BACT|nr:aminopeptidase [Geothermobacter ehrlichii]TYP00312.1 putative aminopeptidase [Geothermobacter ehrlichii]